MQVLPTVERYGAGAWETLGNMTVARCDHAAVAFDNTIITFGGLVDFERTDLAERFDPRWKIRESITDPWWYCGDPAAPEWRPPGAYLVPGEPQAAFNERMQRLIAFL